MSESFWIEWRYADGRNDWQRFDGLDYSTRVQAQLRLQTLQERELVRIANQREFRIAEWS